MTHASAHEQLAALTGEPVEQTPLPGGTIRIEA